MGNCCSAPSLDEQLVTAARVGDVAAIERLATPLGASPNAKDEDGWSAVHAAAKRYGNSYRPKLSPRPPAAAP